MPVSISLNRASELSELPRARHRRLAQRLEAEAAELVSVYPSRRHTNAAVRAFLECIRNQRRRPVIAPRFSATSRLRFEENGRRHNEGERSLGRARPSEASGGACERQPGERVVVRRL